MLILMGTGNQQHQLGSPQRVQTLSLRMARQEHVYGETKVLPLQEHATILMATSVLEYETEISNMFTTDTLEPVLQKLHSETVTNCLN